MKVTNGIAVYGIIRLWNLGARALAALFLALFTFGLWGFLIGLCIIWWVVTKIGLIVLSVLSVLLIFGILQALMTKRPIFNKGDGWRFVEEPDGHVLSDNYINLSYTKQEQEKFQAMYLKTKGNK